MIDGFTVPTGLLKSSVIGIWKFATSPKDTYHICCNALKGFYRYYVNKDKKYNFVINERLSHHTIYPDGTLITHTHYSILMLDDGNFHLEKFYESENDELKEGGERKVDMNGFSKIYLELDENVKENRFRDFLLVTELTTERKKGSKFIAKPLTDECTDKRFSYFIKYTKLKRFANFSFFVSMSIPREFDRASKKDALVIEPDMYGIYEFHSKVDKQCKDSKIFEPVLHDKNGKEEKAQHSDHFFYIGNKWRLHSPKGGRIDIKDIIEN
ncbi:MAG: hypothetical protein Q9M40_07035 [Sulfurimonas sp.]|nr:hypothetical protein [Sulfurimonas sp.]MDQ7067728.1 hypothetical protein [Sulfurimonas sp.]